ncbi:ankyrin repeat domain-containing protein [Ideonella paludis]|uniref:Ankyrin repeat domain-containing protein n=1 Tax=Ideonella paludis TaxID=1233411 RepID=A0ABS5DU78_9BURK|nr:ankyrin repeat domain-containing protein [Ideonella paludis]MBQ0934700.1 ankyrin repeat domain-containing protein [Ideonella paludis]
MSQFGTQRRRLLAATVLMGLAGQASADALVDFFRAINLDLPDVVRKLIAQGIDPNSRAEDGLPAIHKAFRDDSPKVVEVLIDQPALNVNLRNSAGETPLMMAAIRGNLSAMKRLMERGAQINQEGWTPLHYAASQTAVEPLALLLDKGADINARSPNGSTPLMMAARYGSEDGTQLLLRRGADAQLLNEQNLSASDFAKRVGRDGLAKALAAAAAKAR